ncbi:MAG: ABC transporter ATP-binding protein [Sporichthyaceae bacterium]
MTAGPPPHPHPALEVDGLGVSYGATRVLDGLTLAVGTGEAVAVLGPSGVGKSTLLHTVAGFVRPDAGEVRIDGRTVATARSSDPPERRGVGMVFQSYALWPHLTAVDTVAYPLRRAGRARAEARARATELLDLMGIAHLADRRPAQLSGGEQQRVGVARALAREAPLYLFDEPTAHLDTALRTTLQDELANQRTALGAAILYSTHDVAEAFAVADRVALVRDGAVLQVGPPEQIYEQPADLWAARLTGVASTLETALVPAGASNVELPRTGTVLVRPEWVRLGGALPGRIVGVRYRGSDTDYRLDTPAGVVDVRHRGRPTAKVGESTGATLDRVWLLTPRR